jgi:excisionase family DNA binding protein
MSGRPSSPPTAPGAGAMLPLLTVKQAAVVLNISVRTLWTLTNTREIPHLRLGRAVRFDPLDLSAWLNARKVRPYDG